MTASPTPNRVQPGVPAGGQFAPSISPEADLSLAASTPTDTSWATPGLIESLAAISERARLLQQQRTSLAVRAIAEQLKVWAPEASRLYVSESSSDYGTYYSPGWLGDADGADLDLPMPQDSNSETSLQVLLDHIDVEENDLTWDEEMDTVYIDLPSARTQPIEQIIAHEQEA